MAIFRVSKNRNYTVMSNYHLKDRALTLKSKGLLSMMLSLPEEWDYTTRGLASICKEGVDAIGASLKELEAGGYLVRRQLRDSRGRITDTEYTIYECPHTPRPDTALPHTENLDMDITKHPMYKYLSDYDEKNVFDIEKYLSTRLHPKPTEEYDLYEIDADSEKVAGS